MLALTGHHSTKAGSFKLGKLAAPSSSQRQADKLKAPRFSTRPSPIAAKVHALRVTKYLTLQSRALI